MTRQYPHKAGERTLFDQSLGPLFAQGRIENKNRVILMLQGHPSRFWAELGDGLKNDGHRVIKVHFGLADRVFWGRRPAINYRGPLRSWRGFVTDLMRREGVTDVLYYADRLPYHAVALDAAKADGRRAWAVEHGYLRPDWLTLEPEGMGAFSRFPREPEKIRELAQGVPAPDMRVRYRHSFAAEAFNEVSFGLLQSFGRPLYPLHVSDRPVWPAIDYLSWLPVLAMSRRRARQAERTVAELVATGTQYNLVPLQLEADYQIRASSPYRRLGDFIEAVLHSFSAHAPADRHIVFKIHPLDNGLGRWFKRIPAIARRFGVAHRVHVIRGGDLGTLVRGSKGVVLVNSTVGLHALRAGVPVCAMGEAVYDVEGLTHRSGLPQFWTTPDRMDEAFLDSFIRALSTIQLKGSFYDAEGRIAAIREIGDRVATRHSRIVSPAQDQI